ncbi:MAG: type II toxin-antitoxin system prevent-host-death family antitoxin [Armatimonadetes bacterium]|nr:type II toxin-antitoxin system prevent-host-death family antitoxin [Armatimonadota bacterium]
MKVTNTVELKNRTNRLLRYAMAGEAIIITNRGRPAAALIPLSEDDLEDFILEHSPRIRRRISQAERDIRAGRLTPLEDILAGS